MSFMDLLRGRMGDLGVGLAATVANPNAVTGVLTRQHRAKFTAEGVSEGTLPVDTNTYEVGNHITMPELRITKEGYVFAGWQLTSGDTLYTPNEQYTVKPADGEEIVFCAKWEAV